MVSPLSIVASATLAGRNFFKESQYEQDSQTGSTSPRKRAKASRQIQGQMQALKRGRPAEVPAHRKDPWLNIKDDRTYFHGSSSDVLLVARSDDGSVRLSIIDGDVNADIYLSSYAVNSLAEFIAPKQELAP